MRNLKRTRLYKYALNENESLDNLIRVNPMHKKAAKSKISWTRSLGPSYGLYGHTGTV